MTNSTQEYLVKREAFFDEFEKLGGVGLVGRLLTKLMEKSPIVKDLAGKVSTFATTYATRSLNKPLYETSGKIFQEGMSALKSTTGQSTIKPWFGKSRAPLGIREVTKTKFTQDPIRSIGESVLRGTANTIEDFKTIANKGFGKYIKEDIRRSQQFSKVITGEGGKQFEVIGKRSLPGKIINPMAETGLGMGALTLATNKEDEQGRKRGMASRVGSAIKDAFVWGPLRGPAAAYYGVTEVPKLTKDVIKGF